MVKMVAVLRRPFGMSREEFLKWWLEDHAPRVRNYPGLRKYVVSVTVPSMFGEPVFDGIGELWFDDVASAEALLTSPEIRAIGQGDTLAHTEFFLRFMTEEHVIK